MAATASSSTAHIVSRVAASLLGGYAFTWGFTALGLVLGIAAGMAFDDAHTLVYLLAFLVFLVVFLWAFAAQSLARVWIVLAGGGAAMTAAAWALGRTLH